MGVKEVGLGRVVGGGELEISLIHQCFKHPLSILSGLNYILKH